MEGRKSKILKGGARSLLGFVLSPDNVRRIGIEHLAQVKNLTLRNTEYLFGKTSVETHLNNNFLTLGSFNSNNELSGVLSLQCHPNIPALPPWEWDHWLYNKYNLTNIEPLETLFIHYAVWDRCYTTLFLKPILQKLFLMYEAIVTIIMVCPPGITHLDFIDSYTTRIFPTGCTYQQKSQSLYIVKRSDFVAHYIIRKAVEEDNDDLVAIIPKILEETYGHYYISELLSNEESERQIIVAEYHGCAVGVLCLNPNVNYDLLNREFELIPFNGLKKHSYHDQILKKQIDSPTMLIPEDSTDRLSTIHLTMEPKEEEESKEEDNVSDDEFSLVNLSSSLFFNFLYHDEEVSQDGSESITSIESSFSAVVLNEEYEDHLYNTDRGDMADENKPSKHRVDVRSLADLHIPTFHGEPNAFALEISAALPEHENCLYLLFQAAFEGFPDRDYMVVSFPTDAKVCHILKHFARISPRYHSVFKHELWVIHRSAILGQLWIRPSKPEDTRYISEMITTLAKPSVIEDVLKEAVDKENSTLKSFTFLCEKQIIGCAVIAEEDQLEYLKIHYDLDFWLDVNSCTFGQWGSIEEFLLSPIFQRYTRFFMREIHRQSNFDALFYRLRHSDTYNHKINPIVNCIISMVPILPNPIPEYSKTILKNFELPQCLQKPQLPFGLYLSTLKTNSMIKVQINTKIVIIGAGATTISFLESLIFGRNADFLVIFSNITVVSPHGIAYHKQPSGLREMIFVNDGHLNRRYMDSISLKSYINVVTGVLTSINRKAKYISLNDDTQVPYDVLFLICGEQFQKPPLKKKEVVKKKHEFPSNVFIINTEADAANAFNALKQIVGEKQNNIVVYGHYLEALCCLAALLEFGVSGNHLVYIDPAPDHSSRLDHHDHLTGFFNNNEVEIAVMEAIIAQGVTIYQDYNFVDWHVESGKNSISRAKFESKYKFVDIELNALFIYHSKGVSARTFSAIAKCGLVFNGRLVIDENYKTNDPNIYGAGPLTMYSKKYCAEHLMHKYYNSAEIGYQLGKLIRKTLVSEKYWDPEVPPPKTRQPVVNYCRFPGNLHYLHVVKPGPQVPLDVAMIKCNYGRVMKTGNCKDLRKQGYFRLHLNQFQMVETITCLAKFEINVHNLISLWGKHEILLNHLVLRFDLNMIPDLFDYFNQPWAAAIYHKGFPKILDEIHQILANAETTSGIKLIDEVKIRLEENDWNPLSKMQNDEIEEICRDIGLTPKIEKIVLDFLHNHYTYLPMYAHQLLLRWLLHLSQSSPLFVKKSFHEFSQKKNLFQFGKMK